MYDKSGFWLFMIKNLFTTSSWAINVCKFQKTFCWAWVVIFSWCMYIICNQVLTQIHKYTHTHSLSSFEYLRYYILTFLMASSGQEWCSTQGAMQWCEKLKESHHLSFSKELIGWWKSQDHHLTRLCESRAKIQIAINVTRGLIVSQKKASFCTPLHI